MSNSTHRCHRPHLHMPVIAPPPAGMTPAAYYAQLATDGITVAAVPAADHEGLQITVTYPPQANQFTGNPSTSVPFSTVFSMAGGFVTFYPNDQPFVLPDGAILPGFVIPGNAGEEVGTIILNVWGEDFRQIDRRLFADVIRPTTIVYRGLKKATVEQALTDEVQQMPRQVLVKSWEDTPAQGPAPEASTALQQAHLQRVLSGDGAVFIKGGVPIGEAAIASTQSTPSQTVVEFILHSFTADDAGSVTFISPTSLILALGPSHG
jgi:hypothetical protein